MWGCVGAVRVADYAASAFALLWLAVVMCRVGCLHKVILKQQARCQTILIIVIAANPATV